MLPSYVSTAVMCLWLSGFWDYRTMGVCAGLSEYCQWEHLEISCQSDEVIMISSAFYGRMQYGRCIRRDYGYVGCYADVRTLADTRCSGRRSCRISVPDKLFDGTTPCPEDLKLYLMADYTCVTGNRSFPIPGWLSRCSDWQYRWQ